MIKVFVKKQGNYPVNARKVKEKVKDVLRKGGIVSDAEVSVFFTGEKKIIELAKRYLKEKKPIHSVLSFSETGGSEKFPYPPDNVIRLGEIVICYPKMVGEATKEGKLIEEKVMELVEHGALHLLGIHHE